MQFFIIKHNSNVFDSMGTHSTPFVENDENENEWMVTVIDCTMASEIIECNISA